MTPASEVGIAPVAQPQWEHRYEEIDYSPFSRNHLFDHLGEGWELVSAFPKPIGIDKQVVLFFKRRKKL